MIEVETSAAFFEALVEEMVQEIIDSPALQMVITACPDVEEE